MTILEMLKTALSKLKNDPTIEIAGQNPNLGTFKKVWKGKADWMNYKVFYPTGEYKNETLKTINLPRFITRAWANNYANENTTITVPDKNSNDRFQEILADNNFFGKWNNFIEAMMGLGIGAIVTNLSAWDYDKQTNDILKGDSKVKIQFVRAERVYPITIDDGEVTECAFVTYKTGSCKVVIHWLNEVGDYVISEIAGLGKNGSYDFKIDKIKSLELKTPIPMFQCWSPNITQDDEDEYATAITSKAYDVFFQVDVDYTAFYKEVKLGGKIKYISADMLDIDENGNQKQPYDLNDESIVVVDKGNMDKNDFKTFTDELRIPQLVQAINVNMNLAAMLCGLGSNQFEFDSAAGRPIQTATGVIAKQTELYRNVIKQENYARYKLKDLAKSITYLNNTFTTNPKISEFKDSEVQITFDDNIVEDTDSKKKNDQQEVAAGIMTIAEYRATWYDEDLDSAKQFMQENGMLLDKYILPLQSHVITPEIFVDLVFGENYKNKNDLVEYIKANYSTTPVQSDESGFEEE